MSTDLSDCSKKGDDGQAWYQYDASGKKTNFLDKVGFITECIDKDKAKFDMKVCRDSRFQMVGYLTSPAGYKHHYFQKKDWNLEDPDFGRKCIGPGTQIDHGPSACADWRPWIDLYHMVCAKRPDKFEMLDTRDGWITCCNRSKSMKDSPKGGCHPDFYLGSNECQKACFNNSTLVKNIEPKLYLSNYDTDSKTVINDTYKKNVYFKRYFKCSNFFILRFCELYYRC